MSGRTEAIKTSVSPKELRSILRPVSRSFYLSVRLLPGSLQQPVGLGYLLARATDTIADTADIAATLREEMLGRLDSAIQGNGSEEVVADLQAHFAPLQKNEGERILIQSLAECLGSLNELNEADREDVRTVLAKITQAQMMDLELFGEPGQPRALPTSAELRKYIYLIAGCVGEFWTDLCFRYLRNFSLLPQEEMLELGRQYGAGLQLINILRDASTDLRAGRCYFPADQLDAVGLDPAHILREPDRFETVATKWRDEAERGLGAGMRYSLAIRSRRVRAATVLPALIGARTLSLLRTAGAASFERKVKVSREEVRKMISSVVITLAARQNLNKTFWHSLGRGE